MDTLRLAFCFRCGQAVRWRGLPGAYRIRARAYIEGGTAPGYAALPVRLEGPEGRYKYLLHSGLVLHQDFWAYEDDLSPIPEAPL